MVRKLVCVAAMACLAHGAAFAQQLEVTRDGPFVLAGARELVVKSPAAGRAYTVRILPPTMPVPEGEKAAAVYFLDGNLYTALADGTLILMALEQESWPAYVITIGYDTEAGANWAGSRARDYLHAPVTQDGSTEGGGGEAFARFVVDELKPYIESTLPVDPAKSHIAGHSYGGLFVSNLLARQPDAFAGYMIGSPSVWADGDLVANAGKAAGAGRPAFVSVGEKEVFDTVNMVADADRLQAALASAGFSVTYRVHAGQTHTMEPNIWVSEGLRVLLAKPAETEK